MSKTFVIAEAGSSHDNDLSKAYRLIEAAKECGADACKFQYWSSSKALADRRRIPLAEPVYAKYKLPEAWLEKLFLRCVEVGIEFMCTAYLIEDIPIIAPYVKLFKISAFEAEWADFVYAHKDLRRPVIISKNPGKHLPPNTYWADVLHCVSEYPTPMENLGLLNGMQESNCCDGLSDHTTSTLTGALAVAAGATIVEKHIRLHDTAESNPDYGHSLIADEYVVDDAHGNGLTKDVSQFWRYVRNIREAERCM